MHAFVTRTKRVKRPPIDPGLTGDALFYPYNPPDPPPQGTYIRLRFWHVSDEVHRDGRPHMSTEWQLFEDGEWVCCVETIHYMDGHEAEQKTQSPRVAEESE